MRDGLAPKATMTLKCTIVMIKTKGKGKLIRKHRFYVKFQTQIYNTLCKKEYEGESGPKSQHELRMCDRKKERETI